MTNIPDTRALYSRLISGVNKGLRIVNIRSREVYDSIIIKNRLKSLTKRRRDTTLEMGNTIYRSFKYKRRINQDSIKVKCAEIENIELEIDKWEEELKLVHMDAQKALGSLKALAKPAVITICECGAEVLEGSQYCTQCSKKIDSPEAVIKK